MKDFLITLIDKQEIGENTYSFTFDTKDINYEFEAGQYAHFTLTEAHSEDHKGHSRPLSIASSPNTKETLMIAARKGSSVFINNLMKSPIGSNVYISKPTGNLSLHKDASVPAVFIAGGIGITPVRSIIEKAIKSNSGHEIFLFYANKSEAQSAFLNDFENWSAENKNLKFIPAINDLENKKWKYEYGKIDKNILNKYLNNYGNKIYYIVGPPEMVDSVKELLLTERVDSKNILTEKFK